VRQAGAATRLTTLIVVSIVAATFIAGIITRAQRDDHGPVDLIVFNGKVYAGDGKGMAEAVAIQGNKIVLVGSNREVKRLERPQTKSIDARGGMVLPGFNDAYVHLVDGSLSLSSVDLTGAQTVDDIQSRLRDYARDHDDDQWVIGRGWEASTFGSTVTTRGALDAAVADRPVFLTSAEGRAGWANSQALALAGITRTTRAVRPGAILRDSRGEPSGLLKDSAMALVQRMIPPPGHAQKLAAIRSGIDEAHRLGLTSVQNAGGTAADLAMLNEIRAAGDLKLRVYQSLAIADTATDTDLGQLSVIRKQYGDDPLLKTGAVEVSADAPTSDDLNRLISDLDRRGWQVWVRATTEQGVQWALHAFQVANETNPAPSGGRRHRVRIAAEIGPADVARMSRLGVIASMAPSLADTDALTTIPRMTLGTAWPAAPLDPQVAFREMLMPRGEAPDPPGAISPMILHNALDAYTSRAAYASFDEHRKGTLAPGMLADIVVLTGDQQAAPPQGVMESPVAVTIFDGEVVYTRAKPPSDTEERH
jgi:predicted amidohydrolase YtcJ